VIRAATVLAAALGLACSQPQGASDRPAPAAGAQPSHQRLTIVRAYEVWKNHDPADPNRTESALAAFDAQCGVNDGPFERLRLTTSRLKAADIARAIDDAGAPRVIEDAYARASAALAGPPVTICVYAGELSRGLPFLGGVGGLAVGGGRIRLFLHPTKERFAKLPYTVAHEYQHEVQRSIVPFSGPDDTLIREGKADHFAVSLYPALRPPHTNRLSDEEMKVVWPASLEFRKGGVPQADFMIAAGGPLPRWAGYRLAFEMVGSYLETFEGGPADFVKVPSSVIVDAFVSSPRARR
jgi:uncharacterized protein YjaZ